jgi:hypothetical protein
MCETNDHSQTNQTIKKQQQQQQQQQSTTTTNTTNQLITLVSTMYPLCLAADD